MTPPMREHLLQYAYRKRPVHELCPDLADVPEAFILDWFKDRHDHTRLHSSAELQEMQRLPPEALLQWLQEAVEFVWLAKRKEWSDRQQQRLAESRAPEQGLSAG